MPILPSGSRLQAKRWPVVEIFGPTIQGEGPDAGLPCYFVRFGGCDFRCSWCDSLHAVEPSQVRANSTWKSAEEIALEIDALEGDAQIVVISGGNPALHDLGPLVRRLQRDQRKVSVETQGSKWRDWLFETDRLVVSPKPPSSGMVSKRHDRQREQFMQAATLGGAELDRDPFGASWLAMKIVVFDQADLDWAIERICEYPSVPAFLSVGTDQDPPATRDELGARYRWLCEEVARRPELADVRVLPQLHVIAWGHEQGV